MPVINLEALTNQQPFCAGVIIKQGLGIVITLNEDGLPNERMKNSWRVGAVGGGQEPNETIWECALREAREEMSTEVTLIHSPVTYYHDIDTGLIEKVKVADEIAPFLFQRKKNPSPKRPYKEGLPCGPYIYFAMFLVEERISWDKMSPGDDVKGLVLFPQDRFDEIKQDHPLSYWLQRGAQLVGVEDVDTNKKLWAPADESSLTVARLLR
ncbi:NUDIX hydrolase [Marininema halotolerans]|uniref:NUDIX domain-containing protein n=1 Tax=Marininema halotolerans TaxID=1155944 RepID=A0A1I6SER7_9BACL|nr:NUDIX domain-containing protein [Marininema halotolerans]SFS75461.1 NUDIX domain-containing protein [Marininema halotolerans]